MRLIFLGRTSVAPKQPFNAKVAASPESSTFADLILKKFLAMPEVQEQRYICKICSKSCVSGKSLGGHMRVHLALISASKKAAQQKAEIKLDYDRESSMDQSNSAFLSEEKIKDCDGNADFGDGDQNNSYELRENPKKSWKISDPKHGVSKNWKSCEECGKEFPSLRALSGHMRSHSIKNKMLHQCKTCGKGFGSMKAMFGHMKSHSKKSRVANDSTDSLSDLENLCPVRRKRSRIGYKSAPTPSFSDINGSDSAVAELDEAEEAATCLIMLSRGVRDYLKFDSLTESSGDDSVYFGAESSCRTKKFSGCCGDFLSDVEKKTKMSLSTGKLGCCSSGYAKAFTEKDVSEFDDLDSEFVVEDQMKVDTKVSDEELLSVENETKVDFVCSDGQRSVRKVLKPEQSLEFDDPRSSDSAKSAAFDKDFLVATVNDQSSSEIKKGMSCVHESGFEKNSSENEANLEISKDFDKRSEYKHRTCHKIFRSHHPLGGQNARQKMEGNSSAVYVTASSVAEADTKLDQLERGDNQLEQESTSVATISAETSKSEEHECPICFKVFSSGPALGGHKRAHYNGFTESKNQEAMVMNREVAQVQDTLDLNFPVTLVEGTKSEVRLSSWWVDRSREHEALVLTN